MLLYLNAGLRRYGDSPTDIYRRDRWEFQAVVEGACGPLLNRGTPVLRRRCLWVFGPEQHHGWTAPPGTSARIVVAHFDHVPEPVREWVGPAGMRATALTAPEAARVEALLTNLRDDFQHPTSLSAMRSEHALLELSMLAMKRQAHRPLSSQEEHARRKVSQALAWYAEHLPDRPGVADVAAAVFVSPSHLRRLFALVGHRSPLASMHRVQIERACQLMQNSALPLTEIAPACGYASLSAFSRSFRAEVGISPRAWRSRAAPRAAR